METKGTRYLGFLDREGINALYGSAVAGLCLLRHANNYQSGRATKLYEYMAAGLPFVASDISGSKIVAEESGAGVCVNIDDVSEIRGAIRFLLENREAAQEMGRRGRKYVEERHNWNMEAEKLVRLYSVLLGREETAVT